MEVVKVGAENEPVPKDPNAETGLGMLLTAGAALERVGGLMGKAEGVAAATCWKWAAKDETGSSGGAIGAAALAGFDPNPENRSDGVVAVGVADGVLKAEKGDGLGAAGASAGLGSWNEGAVATGVADGVGAVGGVALAAVGAEGKKEDSPAGFVVAVAG